MDWSVSEDNRAGIARHLLACPGFIAISWPDGNPARRIGPKSDSIVARHDAQLPRARESQRFPRTHGAPGAAVASSRLLFHLQAKAAALLCSAARDCPFQGKILRDIFICLRLVCLDNREGREKSALLRGQSLGRMRSRRGYSLPPETGNRSDAFKLQGLVPCIFFVQTSG